MRKELRVFICYDSADSEIAWEICKAIESGGRSCWIYSRDVATGENRAEAVQTGIDGSRIFLLIYSNATGRSLDVRRHLELAVSGGLTLETLRLDGAPFAPAIESLVANRFVMDAATPLSKSDIEKLIRRIGDAWRSSETSNSEMANFDFSLSIVEEERSGSPALPLPLSDLVHFAVSGPATVAPGARFLIDVWAHLERDRERVLQRAREAANSDDIFLRDRGPVRIARGEVLTLRLMKIQGFEILDPEEALFWEGEIGNASFPVTVSDDAPAGSRHGTLCVYLYNLMIAKLHFAINVGRRLAEPAELKVNAQRFKTAFASYASQDRDNVLRIVQGLEKAAPDLQVFVDVAHLRSGQRWEDELWKIIPSRDVFYLFWSRAAAASEWVDKEWRCALKSRGLDFIDPAPLEGPRVAPPPPELKKLHFNDWVLAYIRAGIDVAS